MNEPLKTVDNRPSEVKDFMTAMNCYPRWYTNKFTNCSDPNWFILHPIPWTKHPYHIQKGKGIGITREWGKLPDRPSIGAVDFYRGSWRFISPWGTKGKLFDANVIALKQKLKAVIIEKSTHDDTSKGISGPIEKWYIHSVRKGERLRFITTDYHVMIRQIIKYMRILLIHSNSNMSTRANVKTPKKFIIKKTIENY